MIHDSKRVLSDSLGGLQMELSTCIANYALREYTVSQRPLQNVGFYLTLLHKLTFGSL